MTIKSSGLISLSDINVELGKAANAPISLNDPAVRTLLAVSSGSLSIANAYGKSKSKGTVQIQSGDVGWGSGYDNGSYTGGLIGSANPNPLVIPGSSVVIGTLMYDSIMNTDVINTTNYYGNLTVVQNGSGVLFTPWFQDGGYNYLISAAGDPLNLNDHGIHTLSFTF